MIKHYCDKCGKRISQNGRFDVNICVAGIYTADLCEQCVEAFDKMVLAFVNDHTEPNCSNCRFYNVSPFEEPCITCGDEGKRVNWRPVIQNEKR